MTTLDPASISLDGTRYRGIPLSRIVTTELRKMFDTRSEFWLMAGIGILGLLATSAVIRFASDDQLTYHSFASAINLPMTLVLPIMAILSVSGEWSQRRGLLTFTLVPSRSRIIAAKAISCAGVAIVTIPLALGIAALGNVVGTAIAGVDPVWDVPVITLLTMALANVLGVLFGFMLGLLFRNAGALVAYVLYSFLLPMLALLLTGSQPWFRDLRPWVDFDHAQSALFDGALTSQQWACLGVTGTIWLIIPATIGLTRAMRAEVR